MGRQLPFSICLTVKPRCPRFPSEGISSGLGDHGLDVEGGVGKRHPGVRGQDG